MSAARKSGSPGDEVQPAFPSVLSPPSPEIIAPANGTSSGRRLALAKWMTSPNNPLTSRVMVNRLWHYHFRPWHCAIDKRLRVPRQQANASGVA